MTVVELVLATLLASVLMVALMQLLDTTLKLWSRGETQRATIEQAGGVARLLAHDLRSLHGGAQGDLLVEWVTFDLDDDGVREKSWARLRLVRQASAAESSRMTQHTPTRAGADPNAVPALVEVCWVVIPISKQGEERAEGRLLRGERRIGERLIGERQASCFDPDFFDSMQSPPAGALDEVTGSVLWTWCIVGDLIQGIGTVVIAPPEGNMRKYFASLKRVIELDPGVIIPSHGLALGGTHYLKQALRHREEREAQILMRHEAGLSEDQILAEVYRAIDARLLPLARLNIRSHMAKLREEGLIAA
jgi:hypothetical protein